MTHPLTLIEVIKESNIINFVLFLAAAIWLIQKKLPALIQQKNADMESQLRQARERCRLAEEQLSIAEKELDSFKSNLDQMKEESQKRITSLKVELEEEKNKALGNLKSKYERDIANLKTNVLKQLENQISQRSMEVAEMLLKEHKDFKRFNDSSFEQTLKLIENKPELLKN